MKATKRLLDSVWTMQYIADPPELEKKKTIGKYIMMYKGEKFLCKVIKFDREEGTVTYLQIACKGPKHKDDNGKKFKSRYDRHYTRVIVYTTKREALKAFKESFK